VAAPLVITDSPKGKGGSSHPIYKTSQICLVADPKPSHLDKPHVCGGWCRSALMLQPPEQVHHLVYCLSTLVARPIQRDSEQPPASRFPMKRKHKSTSQVAYFFYVKKGSANHSLLMLEQKTTWKQRRCQGKKRTSERWGRIARCQAGRQLSAWIKNVRGKEMGMDTGNPAPFLLSYDQEHCVPFLPQCRYQSRSVNMQDKRGEEEVNERPMGPCHIMS